MPLDLSGYRLYVINKGSKDVNAYFIDRRNGYLYPVPDSPFSISAEPTGVAVHPSGKYVYVTTMNNSVYAFAVQSDGSLALAAGSPFPTQNSPQAVVIDPQGTYLYVSHYPKTNAIDAFFINVNDGALTPVPGSPFAEPTSPYCDNGTWDMAVHPSGNYLVLPQHVRGHRGVSN